MRANNGMVKQTVKAMKDLLAAYSSVAESVPLSKPNEKLVHDVECLIMYWESNIMVAENQSLFEPVKRIRR